VSAARAQQSSQGQQQQQHSSSSDGGCACLVLQIKELSAAGDSPPLVLFSGDAFNPSLMSTITFGKQMVPVLNAAGVKAAVVGNHDWDWGLDNFR
jgi:5'-nucleotidase